MAYVSEQITDSVTQAQLSVGSSSAVAVASALQAMAHAAGLNMLNTSNGYQNWTILNQAATTQAAAKILSAGAGGGSSTVQTTDEKES
jgi:hypothetical protein